MLRSMCNFFNQIINGVDYPTIILASTAFIAPYLIEKWKATYRSPKLSISFKLASPDCHITQAKGKSVEFSVYYFRFLVENVGKTQADDCEVLLEKVSKENSAGEMIEWENFTPVNLKWSGIRDPIYRTIQPGRKIYCDIGRIPHPDYKYKSIYRKANNEDQKKNKFAFELPEKYYSQWDCLLPGRYKITISIYGKNTKKITKSFSISWSGKWAEENMLDELVIKML